MAVERHARLEAQGVARRESGGHEPRAGAGLGDRLPERGSGIRSEVELEAVLAGVPGAGDQHVVAAEVGGDRAVVAQVVEPGDVEAVDVAQDLLRLRTLQRDQRDVVALVLDEAGERRAAVAQLLDRDLAVARVRDDEEAVLAGAVDDQVVEDAALASQQQRVLGLEVGERGELAGERVVESLRGIRAQHRDLGHVAEVEEPGGGAHGVVLGEVGAVAHRHEPAGEVGEARARGDVHLVERAGAGFGCGSCHGVLLACGIGELPLCHRCLRVSRR